MSLIQVPKGEGITRSENLFCASKNMGGFGRVGNFHATSMGAAGASLSLGRIGVRLEESVDQEEQGGTDKAQGNIGVEVKIVPDGF
jgi:hypothetical protein